MPLFFRTLDEQRRYLAPRLARWHPHFETGGTVYRRLFREVLHPYSVVLDAGCGSGGILGEFRNIPRKIIGVDGDAEAVAKNPFVTERVVADLRRLPLESETVDVITAEFVLEHLEYPHAVFRECARVLKPGGSMLFLTPNLFNPIILASRLLPHAVHRWFRSSLLHRHDEAHRTFYRANTARALLELCSASGLRLRSLQYAGNPEYIAFCIPLALPAILGERMLDIHPFDRMKMYCIGRLQKSHTEL
ncbi:MAG: class I SAM-dependent methyltransferase [Candidatus Kerfeldbacteria bacterium]|nr:class I SAM-dependent methyltransferase [Candidatus Kerfeldbacteria bacterium]